MNGPDQQSGKSSDDTDETRTERTRRILEEYANELRAMLDKLRRKLS